MSSRKQMLSPEQSVLTLPDQTSLTEEEEQTVEHLKNYAEKRNYQSLLKMIDVATKGHRGQERKGDHSPYISHPIAVAEWLTMLNDEQNPSIDEAILCAAVGHDLLEDVKWLKIWQIAKDLLKSGMSRDETRAVVKALRDLTQNTKKGETDIQYLLRLSEKGSPMACLVKIIDRAHNLSSLAYEDDLERGSINDQLRAKAQETKGYILPLFPKVKSAYPNLKIALDTLQQSMERFIENPSQELYDKPEPITATARN